MWPCPVVWVNTFLDLPLGVQSSYSHFSLLLHHGFPFLFNWRSKNLIECWFIDPNPRLAYDYECWAAVVFLSRGSVNKPVIIYASLLGISVH